MAKAILNTTQNEQSVENFLSGIEDENVRRDCQKISEIMEKATSAKPKMWGKAIVGFGSRLVRYASGREIDWLEVGFSPRKQNITLYLNFGEGWDEDLIAKLGKHKTGMGCLFIKRLSDIDEKVLEKLIEKSVENIRKVEAD